MKSVDELRAKDALSALRAASSGSSQKRLTLRIKIDGFTPAVWRRVRVSSELTFAQLHTQVLCPVIGWTAGFHVGAFRRSVRRPDLLLESLQYGGMWAKTTGAKEAGQRERVAAFDAFAAERETEGDALWIGPQKSTALDIMHLPFYIGGAFISDVKCKVGHLRLTPGDCLQYVYDLGDWWSHTILVESVEEEDASASAGVAEVLDGWGSTPTEDSGGVLQWYKQVFD